MKLVFIDNLREGMLVAQDIMAPEGGVTPLVRKNSYLTPSRLEQMVERGIRFAYIDDSPRNKLRNPLARKPVVAKHSFPPPPKALPLLSQELRKDALESLEEIFDSVQIGPEDLHDASTRIIRRMDTVVKHLVDSLSGDRAALVNINDLKSYDEYTYHHSLSVAVLAIAIGHYLGYSSQELNRVGMCAIMHDIGKTAVPLSILNKPARLSEEEFRTIMMHSAAGYDYLMQTEIQDEEVLRGVLHHHEKMDGTGYPANLKGEEIPFWSRIISVADVYDALTSDRPYRTPMQPGEAIEYIMGGIGSSFDYDVVSAFMRKVELYPVGSIIELSNNKIAVVLSNEHQMRPVVRLLDTGEIIDLYSDRNCLSVVVNRILSEGGKGDSTDGNLVPALERKIV